MTNALLPSTTSLTETPAATNLSAPRMQLPDRSRTSSLTLDELLPPNHLVRDVWQLVQDQLDLTPLEDQIKARQGHSGRTPIAPAILVALWIYAHLDKVIHGRELARRCSLHLPYQWLCGGVSVNYHTLDDFRTMHGEWLEQQIGRLVALMQEQELIDWENESMGQDGMRTRANAGSSSFRSEKRLEELQQQNAARLEQLEAETAALSAAEQAARERAVRERAERIEQAQAAREEVAQTREKQKKGTGHQARASTTDPECRKMKMGDGGFRPAYNVQFGTLLGSLVVVGFFVSNLGSDANQSDPMMQQLESLHGEQPKELLADGNYAMRGNIDAMFERAIPFYGPIKQEAERLAEGKDPYARQPADSPAMEAWRKRMGQEESKEKYRERVKCELPNAFCRTHGLGQFPVRGLEKVETETRWMVLAYNCQRYWSLKADKEAKMV